MKILDLNTLEPLSPEELNKVVGGNGRDTLQGSQGDDSINAAIALPSFLNQAARVRVTD